MLQKLKFENDDLSRKSFSTRQKTLLNIPIGSFCKAIMGSYSFVKKSEVFLWESSFQTESEIEVSFCPNENPLYFYLLNFKSSKNLNNRITIDLPINTTILDNQSKEGSLFWVSSVGVEFMIPPNTQIDFQLIGIPQNIFFNYIEKSAFSQLSFSFLKQKHHIPIFYFSTINYTFQNPLFNLLEIKNMEDRITYTMNLVTNYLLLTKKGFSKEQVSFRDFYNMLLIEKMVRLLPAVREPNIDLLREGFGYSSKKLNRLFIQVFEKSIIEYHRDFHMKYAKTLIEEKQMTIDEVSKQLGFRTTNLFSQVFKRHYFYMPRKYKPKRE